MSGDQSYERGLTLSRAATKIKSIFSYFRAINLRKRQERVAARQEIKKYRTTVNREFDTKKHASLSPSVRAGRELKAIKAKHTLGAAGASSSARGA